MWSLQPEEAVQSAVEELKLQARPSDHLSKSILFLRQYNSLKLSPSAASAAGDARYCTICRE